MKISDQLPSSAILHDFEDAQLLATTLAERVADALVQCLQDKPRALLALSGGNTPKLFLRALSEQSLEWQRVDVVLVDERWVPLQSPDSNEAMIRRELKRNAAKDISIYGLKTPELHPESALSYLEQRLNGLGWPIDVLVLGMGADGHTASLFPGMANLDQALHGHDQWLWVARPDGQALPRVSLSGSVLTQAMHCFLHIEGEDKREALLRACERKSPQSDPIWFILERRHVHIYWAP